MKDEGEKEKSMEPETPGLPQDSSKAQPSEVSQKSNPELPKEEGETSEKFSIPKMKLEKERLTGKFGQEKKKDETPPPVPAEIQSGEKKPESFKTVPPVPRLRREPKREEKRPRKVKQKVSLPEKEQEEKGFNLELLWLKVAAVVVALALIGGAVYFFSLETNVKVAVEAGDLKLYRDAFLVYDFTDRIHLLRDDYTRRKTPIDQRKNQLEANLMAAKGDYAGRLQRKKLLEDAIEQENKQIPKILEESRDKLADLWKKGGEDLDKEYERQRDSIFQAIEHRAKALQVPYEPDFEIKAPELAVNAFRLSLYGAADKVNVDAERAWAEGLLGDWKSFLEKWEKRQNAMRQESLEYRKVPGPKIERAKERIVSLKDDVRRLQPELDALQGEIQKYEGELTATSEELTKLTQPFVEELRTAYKDYVRFHFTVDEKGNVEIKDMGGESDLKEGNYRLFLRAQKDGDEYWSFVPVEVVNRESMAVSVRPEQFFPARQMLTKE